MKSSRRGSCSARRAAERARPSDAGRAPASWRAPPQLALERGRKVKLGGESQLLGQLLDADRRGAKQAPGPFQPDAPSVLSGSDAGRRLELAPKIRVRHSQAPGERLQRRRSARRFGQQTFRPRNGKRDAPRRTRPLAAASQAREQFQGPGGGQRIGAGPVARIEVHGAVKQEGDRLRLGRRQHRLLWRNHAVLLQRRGNASPQFDPFLVPSDRGRGPVPVPHVRKEHEHLAGLDRPRARGPGLKAAPARPDEEELIGAQHPPVLPPEAVVRRVPVRRIRFSGRRMIAARAADRDAPGVVPGARIQIAKEIRRPGHRTLHASPTPKGPPGFAPEWQAPSAGWPPFHEP